MPRSKAWSHRELQSWLSKPSKGNEKGTVGGGPSLYISKTPVGTASWLLRKIVNGVERQKGLGSYQAIDLKTARDIAREEHRKLGLGIDIWSENEVTRLEAEAKAARRVTFEDKAEELWNKYIDAGKWGNRKHANQWINQLRTHVYPTLGTKVLEDITRDDVVMTLEPIWNETHDTATKIKQRVHHILKRAIVEGLRGEPNPAGNDQLEGFLITSAKNKIKDPFPSLPWIDMPRFMAHLRSCSGSQAKAFEFILLTNVRLSSGTGALWSEIDLENRKWIVPADRTKGQDGSRYAFECALSDRAIALLESMDRKSDLVFPSYMGKPWADPCRSQLKNMQKQVEKPYVDPMLLDAERKPRRIVPHGFRATFKTYMEDKTEWKSMVIERCMQHAPENKLDLNYYRSTAFEQRLEAMNQWANWCKGEVPKWK